MFSNELIVKILIYLNDNLNQKIKLSDLEKRFNYNSFYIMRLFKREIGISIIDYINTIKIYKSINMLINTDSSILKVALYSGFSSLEYYSEMFKKVTGFNPQKFKIAIKLGNSEKRKAIKKILELKQLEDKSNYYIKNIKPESMVKVLKIKKNI